MNFFQGCIGVQSNSGVLRVCNWNGKAETEPLEQTCALFPQQHYLLSSLCSARLNKLIPTNPSFKTGFLFSSLPREVGGVFCIFSTGCIDLEATFLSKLLLPATALSHMGVVTGNVWLTEIHLSWQLNKNDFLHLKMHFPFWWQMTFHFQTAVFQ